MKEVKELETIFRTWYFDLTFKRELPTGDEALAELLTKLGKKGFIITKKKEPENAPYSLS